MPKSSKTALAPTPDTASTRPKSAPKTSSGSRSAASSAGRGASAGRSGARSGKAGGKPASPKAAPPKAPSTKAPSTKTSAAKASSGKASAKSPKGGAAPPDRFFEEQRSLLLAEREASLRQAESLRAEAAQLAEEMEPGDTQFDEESGEGGTLNVERERDLALSAQALSAVEEIDRALAKIDAGTYGTCEQCGQPIPKARLKALPYATLCVGCKSGGLSRR